MKQMEAGVRAAAAAQDAGFDLSLYGEPSTTNDDTEWRFYYRAKGPDRLGGDLTVVVDSRNGEIRIIGGQ